MCSWRVRRLRVCAPGAGWNLGGAPYSLRCDVAALRHSSQIRFNQAPLCMPQPQVRGTERTTAGLVSNLRELPSREALALRAQAASQVRTAENLCEPKPPRVSSGLFYTTKMQDERPVLPEALRAQRPSEATRKATRPKMACALFPGGTEQTQETRQLPLSFTGSRRGDAAPGAGAHPVAPCQEGCACRAECLRN